VSDDREDDSPPEKARELSTAIDLIAAVGPAMLATEPFTALFGALAVGGKRLVENHLFHRQARLDALMHEKLDALEDKIDQSVRTDGFAALYIRARETAARSEREEKLQYIRNFLLNAVIEPTSRVEDKEPILRLLDDFSANELSVFVDFCKAAIASGYQQVDRFVVEPQTVSLMVHAFARHSLGMPVTGPNSEHLVRAEARIGMVLRRFEAVTLLDGMRMGGQGDAFGYKTNSFTAIFLRFILEPESGDPL